MVALLVCLFLASTSYATQVTFLFQPEAAAQTVSVAGTFNDWDMNASPLSGPDDAGLWKAVIDLPAGRYQYKFVIDGTDWITDESAAEFQDDGFGGKNSVVNVGDEAVVVGIAGGAAAAAPAAEPKTHEVTFRHRPEGAVQEICVAGSFNNWTAGKNVMTDLDEDGEYETTLQLAPGEYQYKFVINGDQWIQDTEHEESSADDGFGGKNSVITVGGGAGQAVAATGAATEATGEGVLFTYEGEAQTVNLAGEFNNWSTTADPMTQAADGVWQITKPLPAGDHAYKFVINGTDWKEDPKAAQFVDDGFGGKNSVVTVGGATASATAAVAVAGKGPDAPPRFTEEGVLFTFPGPAKSVTLAGDFNGWSTTGDPMTRNEEGSWIIVKPLEPGTYGYKFFVDGKRWVQDIDNPEMKDDGFGGKNSVITVP
jgi:1,4-alpha-glucan branching enzyme